MKLSKYFTLEEMCKSDTALRLGIGNTPTDPVIINNLRNLCLFVLDPAREHFDKPYIVTSGYRSPTLSKRVGSSVTSQHCKGEAADGEIKGVDNKKLAQWFIENVNFDQLIFEYYVAGDINSGWVHISYDHNNNRKQVLSCHGKDPITKKTIYVKGLVPMKR
jgi:hypothetical protein